MRIEPPNIIRITGRSGTADPLKELEKGSELSAQIVERLGARKAVLEIHGMRIHAEFLKGLPSAGTVLLKLEDIKNNSYLFRMVEPFGAKESIDQILKFVIFDSKDFGKNLLHEISRFFLKQPAGIFELNSLLLNFITKQDKKDDRISLLLNKLLKLGVAKDSVFDLSIFLSDMHAGLDNVLSLFMGLGLNREGLHQWSKRAARDAKGLVDSIITEIDMVDDEQEKEAVIRQLILFFDRAGREQSGFRWGEIVYYHDEAYHPVRYIANKKSWIFSVEFSSIGRIDILIKDLENGCHISIFCANNSVVSALQESQDELLNYFESFRSPLYINYYNMQNAVNKIVEIYSYYSLNSVFDVKA
jgi:hypothetical protein